MKNERTGSNPTLPNQLAAIEQHLGPLDYRDPNSLKLYESNPRKHPEKQIVKLMASISEFGFLVPPLVDEDGTVIAGEARVLAARALSLPSIPVLPATHLSPRQVRAYRLADNKLAELSHFDPEALALELVSIIDMEEIAINALGWDTANWT